MAIRHIIYFDRLGVLHDSNSTSCDKSRIMQMINYLHNIKRGVFYPEDEKSDRQVNITQLPQYMYNGSYVYGFKICE